MKKSTLMMAALLSTASVHADEGMWTLYNLPRVVFQQMQTEGFALPYADLYQSEHAVKNAVVNFMALKMSVEFEEGAAPKDVMQEVLKNCKKVEDDCEIFL